MTWRGYVLVLLLLSLTAVGGWYLSAVSSPPFPVSVESLDIIRDAERVRIQRMYPMIGTTPAPGTAFYEVSKMVGNGKAIEPDSSWLSAFRAIITDPRTFEGRVPPDTPKPDVVVRFAKGETKVDVMLDLRLDVVVVQKDGEPSGTGTFISRHADIVSILKPLFPDDRVIQSIPAD